MKKLLFLLLSAAVAVSASAGINPQRMAKPLTGQVKQVKEMPTKMVSKAVVKGVPAPAISFKMRHVDAKKMEFDGKLTRQIDINQRFNAPNRAASDLITEQPEGELRSYTRSGTCLYPSGQSLYYGNQPSTAKLVFANDGQTVYIQNPVGRANAGTWVRGTISGNKITVPLGQFVTWSTSGGYGLILAWGTFANGAGGYSTDASVTEATFTINGNTISMDNTSDDGTYMTGLSLIWDDDLAWQGYMDMNTVFTSSDAPDPYTLITTQPQGELVEYTRTGESLIVDDNNEIAVADQSGPAYIVYAPDGSTVYFKDPLYGAQIGTWVKGTISGNKITLPLDQAITYNSYYDAYIVLAWGESFYDTDDVYFRRNTSVTTATYTIDGNTISLDNSSGDIHASGNDKFSGTGLSAYWTDDNSWFGYMDWKTVYNGEEPPVEISTPENLTVTPDVTTAYVEWDDAENSEWALRYRPYVDVTGVPIYSQFTAESYSSDLQNWYIIDLDEDGNNWELYWTDEAHTDLCVGSASYDFDTEEAWDPDNWLVSRDIKLQGELRFTLEGSDSWPDELMVYAFVGDDVYQLFEENLLASSTPTTYTVDLDQFGGVVGAIAFRHYNSYNQTALFLDDIFIGDPNAEIVDVEIPEWIYVYDIDETNRTIEGLTPDTEYEIQVQAVDGDNTSYWSDPVIFTTLPETTDLYIMGQVNEQDWAADAGTLMAYDEENKVYTATVNIDGRGQQQENYFSFTTKLGANADDWTTIAPYRIGAVSDGPFWVTDEWLNRELSISYQTEPNAFRILGGEYKITVSLENMNVIIEKLAGPEPEVLRGDVNRDGSVTIGDVTDLIDHLLSSDLEEGEHFSPDNADTNLDESISIGDVTALIDFLLSGAWPED